MSTEKENLTPSTLQETNLLIDMPPKMQRFIHLYMTGQYTLNKLAQLLEVHPNTLTNWLKREDVKNAISDMQSIIHDQVQIRLKTLTLKATAKLHKLIDSPIDGVALQAVKDVLDRTGHKPKNEIKVDKTIITVEQKMKELIDSTIVDAEFEEVIEEDE